MPRLPLNSLCSPGPLWTSDLTATATYESGLEAYVWSGSPQVRLFGIFDSPSVVLRLWQLDLYEIFLLLSSFKGFKKKKNRLLEMPWTQNHSEKVWGEPTECPLILSPQKKRSIEQEWERLDRQLTFCSSIFLWLCQERNNLTASHTKAMLLKKS